MGFVHSLRDAIDLARALDIDVCMEINACWGERALADTIAAGVDRIRLVQLSDYVIGTLSTPDIDITDGVYGTSLLSVNGVAANTLYRPGIQLQDDSGAGIAGAYASPPIFGTLKVVVTGAGNAKSGTIDLLFSR